MDDKLTEVLVKVAALETRLQCLRDSVDKENQSLSKALELNAADLKAKAKEIEEWRRSVDQWRWISIGAAMASGGLAAAVMRWIQG